MPAKVRRYAANRDNAEPEIVTGLRQALGDAVRVQYLDVVDLLIGYEGRNVLMEIKTGKGKLRPGQLRFLMDWPGEAYAVNNVEDAINAVRGALDVPPCRFEKDQWYCNQTGMFYQVTSTRYLLGEWWIKLNKDEIHREGKTDLVPC